MDEMMRALADPVGYVEANGGLQGFLQRQLTPSNAPVPSRITTPTPALAYPATGGHVTPVPGSLPHHAIGHAAATTLGSTAAQVGQTKKTSKMPFVAAALVVVVGAIIAIVIVTTSGGGVAAGSGSDPGSQAVTQPDAGSAIGHGSDMTVQHGSNTPGSNTPGSGGSNAILAQGSGSQMVGSNAGSNQAEPATTTLRVTTTPPGAKIYIDGIEQKVKTPAPIEKLSRKPIKLVLKLPNYDDITVEKLALDDDVVAKEFIFKKKGGGGGKITGSTGKGSGTTTGKGSGTTTGKGSGTPGKGSNDSELEHP